MLRQLSRALRACLALTVLGAGLIVGTAGTAAATEVAPSWTQTYTVQFGDKGEEIGTATVSRYDGVDEDTIVVDYTIPGGYTESQLCVSSSAFTQKTQPGSCEFKNLDPEGDSGSYTVTAEPGSVVYLQLHIATQGETAYMGWVHGSPSYGNVVIPNVPTCPAGYTAPDGDMVDADKNGIAENCDFVAVAADCPGELVAPEGEDAMDTTGDGVADNCVAAHVVVNCPVGQVMVEGVCETPNVPVISVPVVLPDTCPDGSLMTDVNDDGQLTDVDCTKVLPDTATPPAPATPATPATPEEPAVPVEPVPSVLPDAGVPTVVPVAAPAPAVAETAVLGAQVQRAPLARTGSSSVGLAAFGALLLALGTSSTLLGRRTARSC